MKAMPTTNALPVAMREGMKGCSGCQKIGLKSEEDIWERKATGAGSGKCIPLAILPWGREGAGGPPYHGLPRQSA